VKRIDRDAMQRAIDWVLRERPEYRENIEQRLKREGFEQAGQFAVYVAQDTTLRLKPWECTPSSIWGYSDQSAAIALRDRLLAAGLSVDEPNPIEALAKAERNSRSRSRPPGSKGS
jgi:hypothetical protein